MPERMPAIYLLTWQSHERRNDQRLHRSLASHGAQTRGPKAILAISAHVCAGNGRHKSDLTRTIHDFERFRAWYRASASACPVYQLCLHRRWFTPRNSGDGGSITGAGRLDFHKLDAEIVGCNDII